VEENEEGSQDTHIRQLILVGGEARKNSRYVEGHYGKKWRGLAVVRKTNSGKGEREGVTGRNVRTTAYKRSLKGK